MVSLYTDRHSTAGAVERGKWEQQYNSMGDASVMIEYEDSGTIYGGGFELSTIQQQINTGRMWIIRFIY